MGSLSTGGGSSAIAASSHAACARHRHTDPLVTGMSRRKLASQLGHPDTTAGIPEARWMRAMTFERLVRDDRFVSQLLTTAVGALDLPRPTSIRRADCHVDAAATAAALDAAHQHTAAGAATILTGLAVPFVGMEDEANATPVKPDFAIVAPRLGDDGASVEGSWLILGDAKDYERVRSRIDDQRMLKGFLQVALGAESAAAWSKVPADVHVHRWGALAVPRNAFLQPEAIVECLDDHREEVRTRAAERRDLLAQLGGKILDEKRLTSWAKRHEAAFDPRSCVSCSLFQYCRNDLRVSAKPAALLTELGVRPEYRPTLEGLVAHGHEPEGIPESVVANVRATIKGLPELTRQNRVDPVGEPGTVEVVMAKADAAALGVHGFAVRRVQRDRTHTAWNAQVFTDPQSPKTRLAVMKLLGEALRRALADQELASPGNPAPVHLVVPDSVTGDVLVSIADSLAGTEISRLRWEHDRSQGRPALTFDGEPAKIPAPLSDVVRLAVSFLLEADRGRAMRLRNPLVDLRNVLAAHVVPGGPAADAGRLDYLVTWAEATTPLDHRRVSDTIAGLPSTPGARLANARSDAIHTAQHGKHSRSGPRKPDLPRYEALVRKELAYKQDVVDRAGRVLSRIPQSNLRSGHRALEMDAQAIWRRRLELHASDLVRFGRTPDHWRNRHVELLEADTTCSTQLAVLANPQYALDLARTAGTREVALATVLSTSPLRVQVHSRRITDGSGVVAITVEGTPCVEDAHVDVNIQKGSFKLRGLSVGELTSDRQTRNDGGLVWDPSVRPNVRVGSELVVADAAWFKTFANGDDIAVARPSVDKTNAPGPRCDQRSRAADPAAHRWCCRSHEDAEAEIADWMHDRRQKGQLNPQTWPPIVDEDEFDVSPKGAPTATTVASDDIARPPADLTIDDLD